MGTLCVMNQTGDTKTVWDKNNRDEVEQAKKTFDDLKAKGYLAYSVQPDGKKGQIMHSFDPNEEKVILSPPMRGG